MSYLSEKVSYLQGLAEGMNISDQTNEGKLLLKIIDALDDFAGAVSEITEIQEEMQMQVDEIDDDLAEVEDAVFDDDECGCGCDDEFDDDFECQSFECPNCGEEIFLDEDFLEDENEEITCPNCGEVIELEFDCDCHNCDCHAEDDEK